ncbi:MAG: hypothetical protein WCY11_11915 [Novosphingobium sp.]
MPATAAASDKTRMIHFILFLGVKTTYAIVFNPILDAIRIYPASAGKGAGKLNRRGKRQTC